MKNAKWVVALRPMSRQFADWYGQRNWNREAIVKTMTRIDVPAAGRALRPVAAHRGGRLRRQPRHLGSRVQRRRRRYLAAGHRWSSRSRARTPGSAGRAASTAQPGAGLKLVARATDGNGQPEPETFSLPQPDGGGGWNAIEVTVRNA